MVRAGLTGRHAGCVCGVLVPSPTHPFPQPALTPPSGKITSIVSKRDKVLAQRIEYALQRDEPLDALSADPDRLPPSQVGGGAWREGEGRGSVGEGVSKCWLAMAGRGLASRLYAVAVRKGV